MKQVLIAILVILGGSASAQLLHGVTDSLSGGGSPVVSCAGAIDLSKGCALPMLGGAP